MTEFVDDPGISPDGMPTGAWSEASERDRVLATAMLEDLKSIPEDQKDLYYQLWKQGVAIGLARQAAEKGQGGKKP
nr:hypothetical protein [uncultured Holophaga sp.]